MNKSIVFYDSWYRMAAKRKDSTRLAIYDAVFEYIFDGKQPATDNEAALTAFDLISQQIERDKDKYAEIKRKRSEAGKRGMNKRWNKNEEQDITNDNKELQGVTNIADNVNVNGNVNVTHSNVCSIEIKKNKKGNFCVSENHEQNLADALAYSNEKELGLTEQDISDWYAYNQSTGWMNKDGVPYVDRKASLRGFARGVKAKGKLTPVSSEQRGRKKSNLPPAYIETASYERKKIAEKRIKETEDFAARYGTGAAAREIYLKSKKNNNQSKKTKSWVDQEKKISI